ncbi:MAG: nucleotidyltransferase family protein [Candidatus Coatesbacteria bacterium]|nr:nucleotidyltransferase family protein [Candidatus Coatesbacteria bacterium]
MVELPAKNGFSFTRFDEICKRFRLTHVVAYGLKAFEGEAILPPEMHKEYESHFWSAAVRNEFWMLGKELPFAVKTIREAGDINPMLLKGPVIAALNYDCPGLRLFGDLDLLVRLNQIQKAAEALLASGFEVPEGKKKQTENAQTDTKTYPPLVRRSSTGQSVTIDLHWRLSDRYDTDEDRLWKKSITHEFNGCPVLVPSPEHRLYHLSLHTAQHGFTPDVWNGSYLTMQCVQDMDAVIRSEGDNLDWDELREMVSASNVGSHCHSYLKLGNVLFGTAVPDAFLEALEQDASPPIVERDWPIMAKEFLFEQADDMKRLAFSVLLRSDFKRKVTLRYLYRRCFPPSASIARHYGIPETSLKRYYYCVHRLLRPRIIKKGIQLSFRLVQMVLRKMVS